MIQIIKTNGTVYGPGLIQIINKYGKPKTPFVPIVWGTITGILSNQTDLQNALNLKEDKINKGVANGYASLNGAGLVPSTQLPSYVDDVVEVATFSALPMPGETGKIYVTLDTNKVYRWSGSVYIEIAANPAVWGTITGTLTAQTDLTSYLSTNYYPLLTNPAGYITSAALAPYLTSATAASTYYPLTNPAGYITSSALTPYLLSSTAASTYYPLTNPAGYITASALAPYLTAASAALTYYPIPTGTTSQYLRGDGSLATFPTITSGTVTSVNLTMPSAFTVSGNPVTSSGTLAVVGAGIVSQYIRGDGTLANFPTSTGGGSSVSYYLNGSVAQGTIGGIAFKQMNKTPVIGGGTDFTINANGYIQSFITDANDPNQLTIPAGNWNFETYFSSSSAGGSPSFYVELYKWNGTTLTLIASNSATPEYITNGTAIDLYITALAVPQTTLTVTDRLAIRIYVTHSSKTITLHTEDNHLCQIITTFSTGLTALNGLTAQVQSFGNDTNVTMVSSGSIHTLTWAGTLADSRIASATTWNAKAPIDNPTFTTAITTPIINGVSSLLKVPNTLVAGYNPVPRTGTATDGVTSVLGDLKSWNSNYHSGEVLYSEISGEALNFGQLCYRNAAGKWQKATGSSSAISAYNMLGICLQTVAGIDTAISILTRGYVETTYLSAGAVGNPLFMSAATAGSITNTAPSTTGNVVRIIGNVFWSSATQTNAKWILYFNPDNTWIEL